MSPVRIAWIFLLFLISFKAAAQLPVTPEGVKQPRILILMDGSSSMLQPWNDKIKRFDAAAKVVSTLMDSIYHVNSQVEFGLRVYGHQFPAQDNNCTDTKREVMFSKDNYTQMALRMASLHPSGVSPIAYALKEAATLDLEDELHNAYSIILLTDGGESCNGDICQVVETLISRKIFFKPYIVSMVDYAPLRNQYSCLGNFLTVGQEKDLVPAVMSIVNDYRPLLKLPSIKSSTPAPAAPVDIKTLNLPKWVPDRTPVRSLNVVVKDNMPQMYHYNPVLQPGRQPSLPLAKIEKEPEPVPVPTPVVATVTPAPHPRDTARPAPPVPTPPPPVRTAEPPAKTTSTIKELPPVRVTNPVPKPKDKTQKEITFTTSVENAPETGTRIYFTDGHGKFYKTTPKLQLKDTKTGATVKEFYRTIDASGNPDLQQLPAGTYTLAVPGRSNALLRNIVIQADKLNKIVAVVSNGSLSFSYADAPNRPVEEFTATVNILFEPGPTVQQKCSTELEYPPGNYHIEIDTRPVTKYNTDIDFGSMVNIARIKQPGYVQFTNTNPVGKITLYYPLGDQFVRFYTMELDGQPEHQKLRLQPGAYEVHWSKNASQPYASETVYRFNVKSNAVTDIELH